MMEHLNLEEQWAPFTTLMPLSVVASLISPVLPFFEYPVYRVIPSIGLHADGPAIECVWLISMGVYGQVWVTNEQLYDFIGRRHVRRLRWRIGEVGARSPGGPIVHKAATLELYRDELRPSSSLSFVGDERDRDEWIKIVREHMHTGNLLV